MWVHFMGIVDYPIVDMLGKVKSWVGSLPEAFPESLMLTDANRIMSCECGESLVSLMDRHQCCICSRLFCRKCLQSGGLSRSGHVGQLPLFCKSCYRGIGGTYDTIHQYDGTISSHVVSTEFVQKPLMSKCSSDKLDCKGDSQQIYSPRPIHNDSFRSFDEDEGYSSSRLYFSPSSDFSNDTSDVDLDSMSVGTTNELYSFRSANSSPLESPTMALSQKSAIPLFGKCNLYNQSSACHLPKIGADIEGSLKNSNESMNDNFALSHKENKEIQQSLDFENDEIWDPPPAEDEDNDEFGFLKSSDEDDDVGDSAKPYASCSFSNDADAYQAKESSDSVQKEALRSAVHGHFRALVSQLLQGEAIQYENENKSYNWLDVVSSLAWQAANYVKPDTSKGGSMDPGDYIKVKCLASGSPSDSILVKGVVCTKSLKHKRMKSQFKNPKLFLLGGALEYHKVPNELASINTLRKQEIEFINKTLEKIEALRPNVLLVEKSVSSYAQELLLEKKEISLVLNVKRSLLERIERCTGAQIAPSVDSVTLARLGHCETFRTEKFYEECVNHPKKHLAKTLMFFEGCPKRLGCTVLLRGANLEELKKVKHAVQYACFAASHLSLETSFLADEGATFPKLQVGTPCTTPTQIIESDSCNSNGSDVIHLNQETSMSGLNLELQESQDHTHVSDNGISCNFLRENSSMSPSPSYLDQSSYAVLGNGYQEPNNSTISTNHVFCKGPLSNELVAIKSNSASERLPQIKGKENIILVENRIEVPRDYFSAADSQQSILVSLSITCIRKSTICEHSKLFRIKFYGSFDKPLGSYLRDDLFNQTFCCHSCKEPTDAHVRCYIHQQGSLSIRVKRLPLKRLPGEQDGKIWMWHRCLKCEPKNGVPPSAGRTLMSDAAWGLSFGKFLELCFSNHTTANRVASCGHSLQRDCLRFYGCGSMVATFRYSPVDILSVHLPSFLLDFTSPSQQEWLRQEAKKISQKIDIVHKEISKLLEKIERNITIMTDETVKRIILKQIMELKDLLDMEKDYYDILLQPLTMDNIQQFPSRVDILELNRLRREILIDSYEWDRQLYLLEAFSKGKASPSKINSLFLDIPSKNNWLWTGPEEASLGSTLLSPRKSSFSKQHLDLNLQDWKCNTNNMTEMNQSFAFADSCVGHASLLATSQQVCTSNGSPLNTETRNTLVSENSSLCASTISERNDLPETRSGLLLMDQPKNNHKANPPVRVYSFDSALRIQKRVRGGYYPFSFLGKSFDSPGEFTYMGADSTPNMRRAYSQSSPRAVQKLHVLCSHIPVCISSATSLVSDGARLMLPQGLDDIVIAIFDNEPTSIISYAMTSRQYADYTRASSDTVHTPTGYSAAAGNFTLPQPATYLHSENEFDDPQPCQDKITNPKETHFKMSFDDEYSFPGDKVKFSVTCYFAKQFDLLRKKCCPNELDYLRSLCRCNSWNAQGGKSNVYFAKSWDERFIIKQVTKTELDSFEDFAHKYFKYLSDTMSSRSPTCLAKVLGIYQVNVKHLKGGKEWKMDFMVMENLFFGRTISRVYDLKGSLRSRYNPDTSGSNKVLLDMNLLETLGTKPILLGSKAKRRLERAVWNDTSFLASTDVMDYSLLAGIDEERKELVVGIIDFMRQYTWDKHLETWVKASGILGGLRDESPTVISPMQYKKRFRKAMSKYFLTVPDQWSSEVTKTADKSIPEFVDCKTT